MESVELPEHQHAPSVLTVPVSVTISMLAVLVAGVTLLSHRAHTEELLLQTRATDQWAYYQAKDIRLHEMQAFADVLDGLSAPSNEKAQAVRQKYLNEVNRYQSDKGDIGEKARELEKEREVIGRRADRFDGGEALLEVGLVICSITLLTKRRLFWFGGMLIGAAGVALALTGLLIH